jgi:chaperonin GroEL
MTDTEKMNAQMENPYILLYDGRLSSMNEVLPLLEQVSGQSKSLVIIADEVEGELLGTLVVNKLRGVLNTVAIKAPAFGDRKKEIMNDIAILTGGTFITQELGLSLEDATLDMLGTAEKVTVGKDSTTIVNGAGTSEDIQLRISQIKAQIENSTSDYDTEKLQERLAKLSGGVAVLYIGAGSEVEMKEKKDRVDDALQATRAAIEEGIVEGGGIALIRATKKLIEFSVTVEDADEELGVNVVIESLKAPFTQILENGGYNVEEALSKLDGKGFNAKNGTYVDMFEAGIIDPKKVTRVAIENAVSVVGMIMTTECMVVNKKEDKPALPMMPPMM